MPLDTYLAFVAASSLLLIIPGPTVMLVVGFALTTAHAGSAGPQCAFLGLLSTKGLEALV